MDEIWKLVVENWWVSFFIVVNQSFSMFRTWLSKKTMSKDVKEIKSQVTHNGGETNSLSDKVDRLGKDLGELKDSFRSMNARERARLELALNLINEPVLLFNTKGDCTFSNKALQIMFGMSKEDIRDDGWLKVIENQAERIRVKIAFDFSMKEQIAFNEEFILTNQGTQRAKFHVAMSADLAWDDYGIPVWVMAKVKLIP